MGKKTSQITRMEYLNHGFCVTIKHLCEAGIDVFKILASVNLYLLINVAYNTY